MIIAGKYITEYIVCFATFSISYPDLFEDRSKKLDQLSLGHNKIMQSCKEIMMLDNFLQLYDKFNAISPKEGTYIVESRRGELFVKEVKKD
jgi:hypothetical protein